MWVLVWVWGEAMAHPMMLGKGGSYVVMAREFFTNKIRDPRGVSRPCHRGKVRRVTAYAHPALRAPCFALD